MKNEGISQKHEVYPTQKTGITQRGSAHQGKTKHAGFWKELDRQSLLCQAMWELIKEKNSLTDNMLLDKIQNMGLMEPYQNGKIKEYPVKCSHCNRYTNHDRHYCIYCGTRVTRPKKGLFLDILSVN